MELEECIKGFTGKTLEECIEKIAEAKYRESLCKGHTGRKALMFITKLEYDANITTKRFENNQSKFHHLTFL